MKKKVILLNGASSSGKSTLAKVLQKTIEEEKNKRYEIISIDGFLKMTTEDVIYEDDVFEVSGDLCRKVLQVLKTAPGAIVDHVITSERIFCQIKEMLGLYDLCLIHVTCPLSILREREKNRKNRCLGSAESSYEYLFPKEGYDLTVDTHVMTAKECSLEICRTLLSGSPISFIA